MTEKEIISKIRKGDRKVIAKFYQDYMNTVKTALYRSGIPESNIKDSAQDVFQKLFVWILSKEDSEDKEDKNASLNTFIYKVAKNTGIDFKRKQTWNNESTSEYEKEVNVEFLKNRTDGSKEDVFMKISAKEAKELFYQYENELRLNYKACFDIIDLTYIQNYENIVAAQKIDKSVAYVSINKPNCIKRIARFLRNKIENGI